MSPFATRSCRTVVAATVVALLSSVGITQPLAAQSLHFHTLFGTSYPTPTPGGSRTCYPELNPLDPIVRPQCVTVDGVASLAVPGAVGTFEASSGPGLALRSRSTVTVTNGTAASYTSFARSGYADAVTFSGELRPATIQFAVDMDGFSSSTDPRCPSMTGPCPYSVLTLRNHGAESPFAKGASIAGSGLMARGASPVLDGFISVAVLGDVNYIGFLLSAVSFLPRPEHVQAGEAWSGNATTDFFNSAYLRGVSYLDGDGLDITDRVTASWSSGETYARVPEPGSLALCGAGLIGLLAISRRRRQ